MYKTIKKCCASKSKAPKVAVIEATARISGRNIANENPRIKTKSASAEAIAIIWPRNKSWFNKGFTSSNIAGGPVTSALLSP